MCKHVFCGVAVGGRVQPVEAVGQHGNRGQACFERSAVGVHVYSVCKAADHERSGRYRREFVGKPPAHVLAVFRAVPCAYHRNDMACVQVGTAFCEEHERRVDTAFQSRRVGPVGDSKAFYAVFFHKLRFLLGFLQGSVHALDYFAHFGRGFRGNGAQVAAVFHYHRGTACRIIQFKYLRRLNARQQGQGYAVDSFGRNHSVGSKNWANLSFSSGQSDRWPFTRHTTSTRLRKTGRSSGRRKISW